MTTPKTFGQIAWEKAHEDYGVTWDDDHSPAGKAQWERIAAAVALECSRICTEIAAEHMRQAQGGDSTGASDYRQQAAIECAEAIREAISCGSNGGEIGVTIHAADKEIANFLEKVRATCKATLSAPPGTAVDIDPAVVAEMHKFMRDEPSVFDRIAMHDVVSLAAYIENIAQKDESKDAP